MSLSFYSSQEPISRRDKNRPSGREGFTLIELLIVVAIIAVLAAIAAPNFLEAQIRAKVARCKADMRSMALSLDSYFADNNTYFLPLGKYHYGILTSPIAYISKIPIDVFSNESNGSPSVFALTLGLSNTKSCMKGSGQPTLVPADTFMIRSKGPNNLPDILKGDPLNAPFAVDTDEYPWVTDKSPKKHLDDSDDATRVALGFTYDATNGSVSRGDVVRTGGQCPASYKAQSIWFNVTNK